MGVGKTEVGEMGKIIGKMGIGKMGDGKMGVNHYFILRLS